MNEPPNFTISQSVLRKIETRLRLETNPKYLDGQLKLFEWVRDAYNVFAEECLRDDRSLPERVLTEIIPGLIFDYAVEKGWHEVAESKSPTPSDNRRNRDPFYRMD